MNINYVNHEGEGRELTFFGLSSGAGNGLGCFVGGASCHFSSFFLISSLSLRPVSPVSGKNCINIFFFQKLS
jgi:hypothetical protein